MTSWSLLSGLRGRVHYPDNTYAKRNEILTQHEYRTANSAIRATERLGLLAGQKPCDVFRRLAQAGQEGVRRTVRDLRQSVRSGAVLRMDRRPEEELRRNVFAAEVHGARPEKHLVEDQHGEGAAVDREREDEAGRPEGGGEREAGWAVGRRLRFA